MVPLFLFQIFVGSLIPDSLQIKADELRISHPEFVYQLFNDSSAETYLKTHYPEEVFNAYDDLIPGAYKADLLRLCVLYKEGGIYIDVGMSFVDQFDLKTLTTKNHFVRDIEGAGGGIYNALMVSEPGNPEILEAIVHITRNVRNRYYGEKFGFGGDDLQITGPLAIKTIITKDIDLIHIPGSITYSGIKITINKNDNYRKLQKDIVLPNYHVLFKKRRVYKNRIIPQTIHYTFKNYNLPQQILEIIGENKRINPYYNFIFYNDTDVDNFIRTNFPQRVYSAFKVLNPNYGAMKADFFRYCVMYIKGGVYLDIKISITKNLYEILDQDDECLLDKGEHALEIFRDKNVYEQWLLICKPGHVYYKEMIDYMVSLIEKRYNPPVSFSEASKSKQRVLKLTGPDAFAVSIENSIKKHGKLHSTVSYTDFTRRNDAYEMYKKNNLTHYSHNTESLYVDVPVMPYIDDGNLHALKPRVFLKFVKNKFNEITSRIKQKLR